MLTMHPLDGSEEIAQIKDDPLLLPYNVEVSEFPSYRILDKDKASRSSALMAESRSQRV